MPPPCLGQYLPCVYLHSLNSFPEVNGLHIWLQIHLDKAKKPLSSSVRAVLMMAAMCWEGLLSPFRPFVPLLYPLQIPCSDFQSFSSTLIPAWIPTCLQICLLRWADMNKLFWLVCKIDFASTPFLGVLFSVFVLLLLLVLFYSTCIRILPVYMFVYHLCGIMEDPLKMELQKLQDSLTFIPRRERRLSRGRGGCGKKIS